MNGFDMILSSLKTMIEELYGEVKDEDGMYRTMVQHIGVSDMNAILEVLPEGGFNRERPYPILHFHLTLAVNVPEEYEAELCLSLNRLNNAISVGDFPSFGCFAYHPGLRQIYLTYRLPVNPDDPDNEAVNIRYYLGVLYEELDALGDYILFLCNNEGKSPILDEYLRYLKNIDDWNDIERRSEELSELLREFEKENGK